MNHKERIAGAIVVFSALAAFSRAFGIPPVKAPPADERRYSASCSIIRPKTLEGYVSSLSTDTYLVQGEVRFRFDSAQSMSRPEILVQADGVIPAGKTVLVASAPQTFELLPGETCRFSVKGAIRKQQP